MFVLGHVGITLGAVQAFNARSDAKLDLRAAAIIGLAPDLLDKPLALSFPEVYGNNTRLYGHSLLASLILLATVLILSHQARRPMLLWGVYFFHLLLDRIWNMPRVFLWPFLGPQPRESTPIFERWFQELLTPYIFFSEILGLTILVSLAAQYRLYEKRRFAKFIRSGFLEAPRAR